LNRQVEAVLNEEWPMFARVAFVAMLPLILLGPAAMSEEAARSPENATEGSTAIRATCTAEPAECELEVGRYYLRRNNHIGAINRFKVVVTLFQSSRVADEALFRLAQAYLTLGIRTEAAAAAAVLDRKYPDSHWRSDALDLLKNNGLEPAEDEKSWIIRAFRRTRDQ
jgi:outer membrane protein assembly factor BamD